MSTLIEQIKLRLPILAVCQDYVPNLKPTRPEGWWVGQCPFHQSESDKKGKRKFWIDARPGRQLCSCFVPRCAYENPDHKPMDVINFYARIHSLSNRAAFFELAELLGLLEGV